MWNVKSHCLCNSMTGRRHGRGILKRMNVRAKNGGSGLVCASKKSLASLRYTHIKDVMKGKHDGFPFLKKGFWFSILKHGVCAKGKSHKKKQGKENWKWGFTKSSGHEIHIPVFSFSKEGSGVKTPLRESECDQNEHDQEVVEGEDEQNEHTSAIAAVVRKTLCESEGEQNEIEKRLAAFEDKQNKQALAVEAAAKAAVAVAHAAAMIAHLTVSGYSNPLQKSAAIRIQSVFRGYLTRRRFHSLRGLIRLHALVNEQSVRRQTKNTLLRGQVFLRIHSQIHSRRIRMAEQNQIRQHYLEQKHQKFLMNRPYNNDAEYQEEWNNSIFSKEEIKARLQNKTEASIKRERTLAYAFCHQLSRNSPKAVQTMLMEIDLDKPRWGWSWLERWMATRPWDNYHTIKKAYSVMKLQYVGQNGQQTSHIGLKTPDSEVANVGTSSKTSMLSNMSSGLKNPDSKVANGVISSNPSMLTYMPSWSEKPNSKMGNGSTSSSSNPSVLSNISSGLKYPNSEMGNGATSSNPCMFNNEKSYSFMIMQPKGENIQPTLHIGLEKPNSEMANGATISKSFMLSNISSLEDDVKNNHSILRSGRIGSSSRKSLGSTSFIKDDESGTSSFRTRNYMASTESTKAKVRSHSTPKQRSFSPSKETNLGPNNSIKASMLSHRSHSSAIKLPSGPLKSGETISVNCHSGPFKPGEPITMKHHS